MKFVHTFISTKSKVPSLSDIVKAAQTKAAMQSAPATTKTASAAPVKEAGEKGKGNIKNLTAPKFGKPDKEKEEEIEVEVEAEVATKKTKKAASEKEEGESSGQPEAEAKLVNEPKKPEGAKSTGGGKKKSDSDEGESSGQLDVEPLHQKGESTQEKPGSLDTMKASKSKREWIKIANLTGEQKSKMREELEKFWPKKFVDALLADR